MNRAKRTASPRQSGQQSPIKQGKTEPPSGSDAERKGTTPHKANASRQSDEHQQDDPSGQGLQCDWRHKNPVEQPLWISSRVGQWRAPVVGCVCSAGRRHRCSNSVRRGLGVTAPAPALGEGGRNAAVRATEQPGRVKGEGVGALPVRRVPSRWAKATRYPCTRASSNAQFWWA